MTQAAHLVAGHRLGQGAGGGPVVVLHAQDLAAAQRAAQRQVPRGHSLNMSIVYCNQIEFG